MILVFAGAGASKAVNSTKYPTTIDFFEKLPFDIINNILFANIVSYLKELKADKQSIDIEEVLWTLQQVQNSLIRIQDGQDILGWLLIRDKLATLTGVNGISGNLNQAIPLMHNMINSLTEQIHRHVYFLYHNEPSKEELVNNWIFLIESLLQSDSNIEFFTTNYDVVIESALEYARLPIKAVTGRKSVVLGRLELSCWVDEKPSKGDVVMQRFDPQLEFNSKKVRLTKLHGSIDWIRNNNDEIGVGNVVFSGNHANHVLIYPGFKGISKEEPFKTFHSHFEKQLQKADVIIFIGFAFRDEYIKKLIKENMLDTKKIIIVDPNATKIVPEFLAGKAQNICMGFDKDAVSECMKNVNI